MEKSDLHTKTLVEKLESSIAMLENELIDPELNVSQGIWANDTGLARATILDDLFVHTNGCQCLQDLVDDQDKELFPCITAAVTLT